MNDLDKKSLEKLQLTLSDLQGLTEEEQKKKIRKSYRRLAYRHHPDKGGKVALFREIEVAYRTISSHFESDYTLEINHYFRPISIDFTDTAFDLLLEESIINNYRNLLRTFSELSVNEKQQFAQYYTQFISLAQTLEKKQTYLMEKRSQLYSKQQDESFWQAYQRKRRKLIITLFGEEYLDDFQYRYAIATGELSSILTWRKLFSPVKSIVALSSSIILAFRFLSDLKPNGTTYYHWAFILGVSIFLFTLCALLPTPFNTAAFIILFMPRLINDFLCMAACPVNKIIRPVAQYTGLSPYIVGPALAGFLGAFGFIMISFFPLLSGFTNNNSVTYIICIIIDSIYALLVKNTLTETIERLPLATESVPDKIRETVLQVVKTGHYSAQLFNTPKEAPYLVKEDRTFWQQTSSFFGAGKKAFFAKENWKENFTPVPLFLAGV